jgi:hypothetical protein
MQKASRKGGLFAFRRDVAIGTRPYNRNKSVIEKKVIPAQESEF